MKCVNGAVPGWRMAVPDGEVTVDLRLTPPRPRVARPAAPGAGRIRAALPGVALWSLSDALAAHVHPDADEVWVVLEGQVEARGLGEPVRLRAGDGLHVPRGRIHSLAAVGRAQILQLLAPPGDVFDPESPAGARPAPPGQLPTGDPALDSPGLLLPASAPRLAYPLKGRAGTARIRLDDALAPGTSLSLTDLTVGGRLPPHTHPGGTELLLVRSGSGVIEAGGRTIALKPLDIAVIPADLEHTLKGSFTACQAFSPAGAEGRYALQGTAGAVDD
jgi:quercetin dioxygenase-like cupin family protein